jgi:hypothetical protein
VLVRQMPRQSYDRVFYQAIGPFSTRDAAMERGRGYAASDATARVRVIAAGHVPFAKLVWQYGEATDLGQ